MFTGLIQAVGRVADVKASGRSAKVSIDGGGLDLGNVAIGDSIACNGVCLTVTKLLPNGFITDVSQETLNVTVDFVAGAAINLEKSLRLRDWLGGHLVNGHVDNVGEVITLRPLDENCEMEISYPHELGRYIARKGSIAVNGVSLTVNGVAGDSFSINLIPHTLAMTNLGRLTQGDKVNLEVDLVARYVERMLDKDDLR